MNKSFLLALAAALMVAPLALAHDPAGTPKNYCEDPAEWNVHDYTGATGVFISGLDDGNLAGDCNGDDVPADYDLHSEWTRGGAWLLVRSGDGVTDGTLACFGEGGHHPDFATVQVRDVVLGNTAAFTVSADTVSLVPPTDPAAPNCGDFESDAGSDCVDTCTVTFAAGLDGSYQVYVTGTLGHVSSPP